ncbi:competence type IV pilus minor pilin ComGF [Bacillus weihaiensis]|uniref:competence type IV pilus minor pilin ComGF n=1 Tax=Bacillus weihaiensis TaxID=1547283 RepID=UPI0023563707|nr:competence type IV pilus minor pilin ComGF [Bacillus weihaiensis]
MHQIKKNQLVFSIKNEQGLTFLNLLFSFLIYSLIISSLSIILSYLVASSKYEGDLNPFEWELFIVLLKKELNDVENIRIEKNVLVFENQNNDKITIHKYQDVIRRQVNGLGHEILLLKVKAVTFQQTDTGVKLFVESLSGKPYQFTFRRIKDLKVNET